MENTNMLSEKKNRKVLNTIIHISVWVIVLLLPVFVEYQDKTKLPVRFLTYSIPMLFMVVIFYFNYSYLIAKTLFRKKIWQFFAINLFAIAVFIFCKELFHDFIIKNYLDMELHRPIPPPKVFIYFGNFFASSLVIGLGVAIKMTAGWYQLEAERKELEKTHLESELKHLKNQLNPHFFFNTMNNIYSLISINTSQAQDAIHKLSKLTRYILYDTDKENVPLTKEIEFLKNYINLMSLRLTQSTRLETSFESDITEVNIAPLLFMALVENAFKHGVNADNPSFITIQMIVRDSMVDFKVSNSNFHKGENDKSGSGIGLSNLRKRLELIYPHKHTFNIDNGEQVFSVQLKIEL
jgi:sensor histidine kinase YesM